jgi:hypothetical protein
MMRFLNQLLLWRKFAILAVMGFVLVSVPSFLYIRDSYKTLEAARTETLGTVPAKAMLRTMQLTQQSRGLSALVLGGKKEKASELKAKQTEAERSFVNVQRMLAERVADPAIISAWNEALMQWKALAADVANARISGKSSTDGHTALVAKVSSVLDMVCDHFLLTLDPDVDSYYLIFGSLYHLPALTEDLGRLRARGTNLLTQGKVAVEERQALTGLLEKANEHHAAMSIHQGRRRQSGIARKAGPHHGRKPGRSPASHAAGRDPPDQCRQDQFPAHRIRDAIHQGHR